MDECNVIILDVQDTSWMMWLSFVRQNLSMIDIALCETSSALDN